MRLEVDARPFSSVAPSHIDSALKAEQRPRLSPSPLLLSRYGRPLPLPLPLVLD